MLSMVCAQGGGQGSSRVGPSAAGAWRRGRQGPAGLQSQCRLAGGWRGGRRAEGSGLMLSVLSPPPCTLPAAFTAGPARVMLTLLL